MLGAARLRRLLQNLRQAMVRETDVEEDADYREALLPLRHDVHLQDCWKSVNRVLRGVVEMKLRALVCGAAQCQPHVMPLHLHGMPIVEGVFVGILEVCDVQLATCDLDGLFLGEGPSQVHR